MRDTTALANTLSTIENWRCYTRSFVHYLGWLQRVPEHVEAWTRTQPQYDDPYLLEGETVYRRPRDFEDETQTLHNLVKSRYRELNPAPLEQLLDAARELQDPKAQVPVGRLERLVADAEAVVSIVEKDLTERLRAAVAATGSPPPSVEDFKPAVWFTKNTDVPAERLRKAAARTTKRVRSRTDDGVVVYSVEDARQWWPKDMPREKA